jgi:flagellar biogenesis protein FliO
MLVVTLCCAVWMLLLTGARDKPARPDTEPTAGTVASDAGASSVERRADPGSRPAPEAAPASGELSLYLDTKTTATQTKPEDPAAVLRSGVTVASSTAVNSHAGAETDPAPRANPVDRMRSRQDSLSFGSDAPARSLAPERAIAPERLTASAEPVEAAAQPLAAPDAEDARVIDITPGLGRPQPILQAFPGNSKPAGAKPATQPKPFAAQPKLAAGQPASKPVEHPLNMTKPVAEPKHSLVAKLPPADKPAHPAAKPVAAPLSRPAASPAAQGTSLREHFSAAELASGNDSVVLPDGEELLTPTTAQAQPDATETAEPGVIATRPPAVPAAKPSLGDALRGAGGVGSQVPSLPLWRIGLMLFVLAGAAVLAGWLKQGGAANPFKLLKSKGLGNIIETINLAPGRQIVLVELRGAALVLGVTPQSINLLDRMPLELLEDSYQPTVQQIITRESAARTADWAARPRFAAAGGGRPVAPSLVPPLRSSYGPPPQGRMSVAELRQARATGHRHTGFGELRVGPRPSGAAQSRSKAELIDNLRRQLNQLER